MASILWETKRKNSKRFQEVGWVSIVQESDVALIILKVLTIQEVEIIPISWSVLGIQKILFMWESWCDFILRANVHQSFKNPAMPWLFKSSRFLNNLSGFICLKHWRSHHCSWGCRWFNYLFGPVHSRGQCCLDHSRDIICSCHTCLNIQEVRSVSI